MNIEEPKENKCEIEFNCFKPESCVYLKKSKDNVCLYRRKTIIKTIYTCNSSVAQANAMMLKLKEMGLTIDAEKSEY